MKRTEKQPQEVVGQDLTFQSRGPLSEEMQKYLNLASQTASDEEKLARRLAREKRNKALLDDSGIIALPERIPLAKIRAESLAAREAFQRRLEEKLEAELKKYRSEIFAGDFIELIKSHIEQKKGRRPKTTGELAKLPYFDWRLTSIVPRPRDQGECGSCWAHVAIEAFESRLMYNVNRIKAFNTSEFSVVTQIALSIQGVLDCVTVGDCDGGSLTDAFTHFVEHGARLLDFNEEGVSIDDDTAPTGKKGSCKERGGKGIRALTWDFALPRNPLLVPKSKASIRCIKEALLEYGALAVEITADPEEKFRNYRRGVYKKDCRLATNHFVLLTGWDDDRDAWIILNSFGRNWGSSCVDVAKVREHFPWTIDNVRNFLVPDRGCMYIKRGVSNVGKMAVWIETGLDNEEWLKKARRFKARQQAEEQRFFESLNSGPGKQAARKR